jgi:outer membrane receptor for ferrienterochelin and colicin
MDNTRSPLFRRLFICASTLLMLALPAAAQVTTGNISGTVSAQGDALPGVTIEAVHTPTGTQYSTVSGANGRYLIPNVRVGGPYRLTATLEGFRAATIADVQVGLGTAAEVPIAMQLAAVSEAITVTAESDPIINPNRTGAESTVSSEQIETLPTVNRSIQDFARTNPYFQVEAWDESSTRMTVAGRNNRFNNIQIDGAVNNDIFGLSDTGTPGGRVDAQPISLDAVDQIQLVVSPYDVRQGMFTGGGVNVVTRSGTNDFSGSVWYSMRDGQFVGDGPFVPARPIGEFDEDRISARLGGPIFRDRLFFFINGERSRKTEPNGVSLDGSAGQTFRKADEALRFRDLLIQRHQFDPGDIGDVSMATDGDYYFGRVDWNANNSNQITLRHNIVDATKDKWEATRTTNFWVFPNSRYVEPSKTNSTVMQVNSTFGQSTFNEGRLSYQTIRDKRSVPARFPFIEIGGTGERRGDMVAGTERFSGTNKLNQDILEFTDDFTWILGNHNLVIGTHNEFFTFANIFASESTGYYYYNTLADFENDRAQAYRIGYIPGTPPEFSISQYGLYASDQWRVNNTVTLTFGLRADKPTFLDTPKANPVAALLGHQTDRVPSESAVWSPRFGFNWNPGGTTQQIRGGVGVFTGRTPYVWISTIFYDTGIDVVNLGCVRPSCTPPAFNPDPDNQPRSLGAGAAPTISLVDPDFQFPRILRATLGYDRELFFGVRGTVEGLWSKTMKDVFYLNPAKVQSGTSPLDGRPTYTSVTSQIANAPMLTNTDEGQEKMLTVQLNRPFGRRFTTSASYAWMDTEAGFDPGSSRAISNWQFSPNSGDITKAEVGKAFFEVEHRFNIAATYNFGTGPLEHSVGFYYNVQSGGPYSFLIDGDVNRDSSFSNDLLYVPSGPDAFILCPSNAGSPAAGRPCGGTAANPTAPISSQRLFDFLESAGVDERGVILERGAAVEPWSRQLDFHYELGLPLMGSFKTQLTADVLNALNLIDKEYGVQRSVVFQTATPVRYQGQDAASGKPIYREASTNRLTPGNQFSTANLRSRWQARLGVRVTF